MLADAEANVNTEYFYRGTVRSPLYLAVLLDNSEIVEILAHAGANVDYDNNNKITPLGEAIHNHNFRIANVLINAKANVNYQDIDGNTPLHYAIHLDSIEMVELLIKSGANANLANKAGITPLHCAYNSSKNQIFSYLYIKGANTGIMCNGSSLIVIDGCAVSRILASICVAGVMMFKSNLNIKFFLCFAVLAHCREVLIDRFCLEYRTKLISPNKIDIKYDRINLDRPDEDKALPDNDNKSAVNNEWYFFINLPVITQLGLLAVAAIVMPPKQIIVIGLVDTCVKVFTHAYEYQNFKKEQCSAQALITQVNLQQQQVGR